VASGTDEQPRRGEMKIGDKVICQGTLRRSRDYVRSGRDRAYWLPVVWKNQREGMFIGYRHLSNGEIERNYDEGHIYYPKDIIKVGLVVFNERENPKYIPMNMLHAKDQPPHPHGE
jgi:hypothetical protein